jgi:hypothetical protein
LRRGLKGLQAAALQQRDVARLGGPVALLEIAAPQGHLRFPPADAAHHLDGVRILVQGNLRHDFADEVWMKAFELEVPRDEVPHLDPERLLVLRAALRARKEPGGRPAGDDRQVCVKIEREQIGDVREQEVLGGLAVLGFAGSDPDHGPLDAGDDFNGAAHGGEQ